MLVYGDPSEVLEGGIDITEVMDEDESDGDPRSVFNIRKHSIIQPTTNGGTYTCTYIILRLFN